MTLEAQVPPRTADQDHLGNCRRENPRQWQGRPQGAEEQNSHFTSFMHNCHTHSAVCSCCFAYLVQDPNVAQEMFQRARGVGLSSGRPG